MSSSSSPIITSLQNRRIKELVSLHNKKGRDEQGCFLIENEHLIEEAIKTNQLIELIVSESYSGTIDFHNKLTVTDVICQKLSQTTSKSQIFGVCKIKQQALNGSYYLVCDNVQDPGNLGTLIRSVVCFGWDGVIVSNNSSDFYNDKCVRATQGALFHTELHRGNLVEILTELQQRGLKIVSTDVHQAKPLSKLEKTPMALVVGSEGQGITQEVINMSDDIIIIESSHFDSLNVGVAGSIVLYVLRN